jgi:2-methylcitrate dehydratase PrpD
MGSVAAISKLMNFPPRTIQDALGIVYSQLAGNKQCEIDGATVKRMQPGLMAKAALFSSLLAAKGVSGAKETFDGTYGFFEVYGNKTLKGEEVLEDLGERYLVEDIGFKLFPCCGLIQAPIEGVLELKRENRLQAEDVKRIRMIVPPIVADEVGKEYAVGENPRVDAQFNLSYNVATALLKGDVSIEDFELEAVTDPLRVEQSKKVEVLCDSSQRGSFPVMIEIDTESGEKFSKVLRNRKGDIQRPLTDRELCDKVVKCFNYLERLTGKRRDVRKISEMIFHLEKVAKISEMINLL